MAALVLVGCGGRWRRQRQHVVAAARTGRRHAEAPRPASNRVNNTFNKLLECVTLDGVRSHQAALQAIADANGGTRAAGTPGYDAERQLRGRQADRRGLRRDAQCLSVRLRAAADAAADRARSRRPTRPGASPAPASATSPRTSRRSTSISSPPRANTSGCEAADFAGFPAGNIALVQRGTCAFAVKALNAQAAGASAVIIFNQGNTPEREALIVGTLGAGRRATIPVVGASFADGAALAAGRVDARPSRCAPPQNVTQYNVLAESRSRRPEQRRDGRRAPRLGAARARASTTTARAAPAILEAARADGQGQAAQQAALRLVGRRGVRPGRLDRLRRQPDARPSGTRSRCT